MPQTGSRTSFTARGSPDASVRRVPAETLIMLPTMRHAARMTSSRTMISRSRPSTAHPPDGACAGAGHACAGKNGCKGQGWVKSSRKDCKDKGGKVMGMADADKGEKKPDKK